MTGKVFVLVHGAWHGGWCYARLAERLRDAGHRVFAPTLSGLGERSHLYSPSINASTHVRDIVNVLRFEGLQEVVLVGHSYGGLVATAAADAEPGRIAALVVLDGYVGRDGKSAFDLDLAEATRAQLENAQENGGHTLTPVPAKAFGVNPADRDWVDALCTAQPLATFTERLTLTGAWEKIRNRTYVLARGWKGSPFLRIAEQLAADGGWRIVDLPCGHDVMIDMPDETALILREAANSGICRGT